MQIGFPFKRHTAPAVCLCLVTAFACAAADDCRPLWTGTWFAARFERFGPNDRFALRGISQRGLHLTGQCVYFQIEGQNPRVAVIDGTDAKECGFWPDVAAEVLDDGTNTWIKLADFFDYGHRKSVRIEPGTWKEDLFVSLDIFVPSIGKHRLGRLVLRSGEAAVFELEKLREKEPESAKSAGANSDKRSPQPASSPKSTITPER